MRHLVVCCDGTWNTEEQEHDGVPTPTNVVRLHHLANRPDQIRYYHPGVGTGPGLVDRFTGGGLGVGLARNIKSAYQWLVQTYQPGDAICLFGFSRGAYTVRSLAGMLHACGLAAFPDGASPAEQWAEVDHLYDDVYRPTRPAPKDDRRPPHPRVSVCFLGVWDTVGSLGVPDSLGVLKLFDLEARHRFHDTKLNDSIQHARHAIALDETRGPFTPTLWTETPGPDGDRTVKQVWFPGCHCDVGGGYLQTGLSDAALRWMVEEAREYAGLSFAEDMLEQLRPDPLDVMHDESTGIYRHLGPRPRAVPPLDRERSGEVLHDSAFARQSCPPITTGRYRPTRLLAPGESAEVTVFAREPWNDTGLYLDPGRYSFAASGEWLDGSLTSGPDGAHHYLHIKDVLGSVTGWWQEKFRHLTDNEAAHILGAPRVSAPWMTLSGAVAAPDVDENGAQKDYPYFVIGERSTHEVERPGYLYAFANDAWGCYANNRGSVSLSVRRLS